MSDTVIHIVALALLTAAKISGPVLISTLVIGLTLSIVQSATQIQEQTLTFLPKLAISALVLVVTGSWCLRTLTSFTTEIFKLIPDLLNAS
jgi:flagellar biosynthetic protein FliQ